ncbi:MAG: ATP-binding cassette domain-containing protein [Oscillospiraceae bacterium]|nr:ATP-binding cassette domain-containing protein [Oscillospiraceae bacterium]
MANKITDAYKAGDTIIKLEDVSYRYPRTKKWVLKHINLEIKKGEFIAVMGENGAAKTTLCQCLNSAVPNFHHGKLKGKVTVFGIDTKECEMSNLSDKVGMVLEDPEAQLFTTTVRNEVAFGAENLEVEREELFRRVDWALDIVGLTEFADREPTALSGGQKQRLAIAANLAMLPSVLVLDEPTSQLDPIGTRDVYEVIRMLREKENMTIVIATHKSEEIAEFADKVLVLKEGQVAAFDTPDVIFNDKELMDACSIRPPQVSALASYLRDKGEDIGCKPTLMSEAKEGIDKWYKGARK